MTTYLHAPATVWRRRFRLLLGGTVNVLGGCALLQSLLAGLA